MTQTGLKTFLINVILKKVVRLNVILINDAAAYVNAGILSYPFTISVINMVSVKTSLKRSFFV